MTAVRRKPTAVIVDVDGTLADVRGIRHHVLTKPKDFDAFHAASADVPPNAQAIDFVRRAHADGHVVVVVTARMQKWAEVTTAWLATHLPVPFDGPFHRQDGDVRPDVQVKREIHRYLARHYDIRAACDDNPKVIALWDEIGIPTEIVPGWSD
jgi:hypothetical protein